MSQEQEFREGECESQEGPEPEILRKAIKSGPSGSDSEFDTSFKDERGRAWNIRLTIQTIHAFCREHGLTLAMLFKIGEMSANILLDLAYAGTRYQSRAIAIRQSKEDFLNDLDGPSFLAATGAAANAVLNFCLRLTPADQRATEKARIVQAMQEAQTQTQESGAGNTSSSSQE
jgi:hypothetical protein